MRFLGGVLLAMAILACGEAKQNDGDDAPAAQSPTAPAEGDKPATDAAAAAAAAALDEGERQPATELEGIWKTSCMYLDNGINTNATLTFKGLRMTVDSTLYSDSKCLAPLSTEKLERTFAVVGDAEGITDVKKINFTLRRLSAKLLSAEVVAEANAEAYYGMTNWVVGVTQDVTDKAQDPDSAPAKRDAVTYTIVKVEEIGTMRRYIPGDNTVQSGETEADRPTTLSTTVYAEKQ